MLDLFTSLRQNSWDGASQTFARQPHKPLLALWALGRFYTTGSSAVAWADAADADDGFAAYLVQFGPPTKTQAPRNRAGYPFWHLQSDGVWTLNADVHKAKEPAPTLTKVDKALVQDGKPGLVGAFTPEVEDVLQRAPDLIGTIAAHLVHVQFPNTLQRDVLLAADLEPDFVNAAPGPDNVRSATWTKEVLRNWDGQCAFCGYDGKLSGAYPWIQAAHIWWAQIGGPADPDNGMALCARDHLLFDSGALGLTEDHRITVSSLFQASSDEARVTYNLVGKPLTPRPGTPLPAVRHIRWHTNQVFKGDPIRA